MENNPWGDLTFVAFDTETTGQYPLQAEICEFAAVKWRAGRVIDAFQTLIRPSHEIPQEVIGIHGITNEMVAEAPRMSEVIARIAAFMEGAVVMAHHAAFDVGFLMVEIESAGMPVPSSPVVCTSLLSRAVILNSPNHRLQTLIHHLGLEKGAAHRALDDAKACLEVGLRCFRQMGEGTQLSQILARQGKILEWRRFSMRELAQDPVRKVLVDANRENLPIRMVYGGGGGGKPREALPMGLVRSLDGDYLVAFCQIDKKKKRFFLDKILRAEIVR